MSSFQLSVQSNLRCFGFALPLSQPIKCKTKTNCDLLTRVFPCFPLITCIWFEFWLLIVQWFCCLVPVVIGQSNYFSFGFTALNWKPLYAWTHDKTIPAVLNMFRLRKTGIYLLYLLMTLVKYQNYRNYFVQTCLKKSIWAHKDYKFCENIC